MAAICPRSAVLNSWKEIAAYMGRGVRTVQRWEHLGLPVHRPKGRDRSAVLALPSELDEWAHRTPVRVAAPEMKHIHIVPSVRLTARRTLDHMISLRRELRANSQKQRKIVSDTCAILEQTMTKSPALKRRSA